MSRNNSVKLHTNRWRILGMLAIAALLVFSAAACGKKGDPVAVYDGGEVSSKEFNAFLGADKFFNTSPYYSYFESSPDFKKQMLDQYVTIQYLVKDASAEQVKQADSETSDNWKKISESIKQGENKKQYDDMLKQLDIGEADLKQYLKDRLLLSAVFKQKFPDDQVQERYDADIKADPNAYISIATVDHILVAVKDQEGKDLRTMEEALTRAQQVREKLLGGGDFAALAKEYSDDPGSKDNGGQYKDANIDEWVPEFRKAALELPLNQISEPVKTDYGYHVMKVESRSSNKFTDVKELVRSNMVSDFIDEFTQNDLPKILTKVNLPEEKTDGQEQDGQQQDAGPADASAAPASGGTDGASGK